MEKIESKQFILMRRKEIEQELVEMLQETGSDFSLQDVKDVIFREEDNDDMMKAVAMFDRGGDASELENILELVNDAWNYFPHKVLGGLSPAEKVLDYHDKQEKTKTPKVTAKQRAELWGESGPYSQAHLIVETRILDDKVTRTFVIVEADINPFTYKLIKKYRKHFVDDQSIQQLLDHAEYRGQDFGYVACAFQHELRDARTMTKAHDHLDYTKKTLIKMHRFVMERLAGDISK